MTIYPTLCRHRLPVDFTPYAVYAVPHAEHATGATVIILSWPPFYCHASASNVSFVTPVDFSSPFLTRKVSVLGKSSTMRR